MSDLRGLMTLLVTKMTNRMKQRYDLPLECPRLEAGDAAWLHNPQRKKGLSPKLQHPWQGPYTVTKRINDLIYRVQLGPKAKPKVIHRNLLWRYSCVNAPAWFAGNEQERSIQERRVLLTSSTSPLSAKHCLARKRMARVIVICRTMCLFSAIRD